MRWRVRILIAWLVLAAIGVPGLSNMAPLAAWFLPVCLPFDDTGKANRASITIIIARLVAVGLASVWVIHEFPGYLTNSAIGRRLGPFKPDAAEIGQLLAAGALLVLLVVETFVALYYRRKSRRMDPPPGFTGGPGPLTAYPWDETGDQGTDSWPNVPTR